MVESITASVSNAALVRATAEQANVARAAANAEAKAPQVVQAPYVSPYIHVDNDTNQVVLQIRNGETGKVIDQIPTKSSAEEDRARAEQQAQTHRGQTQQVREPQPAPASQHASFGAFARQVSSLQAAIAGSGTGGTVSVFA